MISPLGWGLAGVALLLWPARDVGVASAPRQGSRRSAAPVGAAVAVGVCCLLLGGAPGVAGAVVAAPLAGLGVARWRAGRPDLPDPALGLVLDLVAAALAAGRPLPSALHLAAGAGSTATAAALQRVARSLDLGAEPGQAWREVPAALAPAAAAAARSADSGARLARTLAALAAETRAGARAAALARAHRVGVLSLLPLGLCFLPAFVCLGIVPAIAGLFGGVLGGAL